MNKQFYDSIQKAEAIVIGAGAGLSEAAGLHYSGEDFTSRFQYMKDRYQVEDMFSASFAPFPTLEEYWGFYSLFLYHNRYETGPLPLYRRLLSLLAGKNYFVLTSNVDAQFLLSGFSNESLFATQGDYGELVCPMCRKVLDGETTIRNMVKEITPDHKIPSSRIPLCPSCKSPLLPHLKTDSSFLVTPVYQEANRRYNHFLYLNQDKKILFLELGVGLDSPSVIRDPFFEMTARFPFATLLLINKEELPVPERDKGKTIRILEGIEDIF